MSLSNMKDQVYQSMIQGQRNRQKKFVVLIDPDKVTPESLIRTVDISSRAGVDYFFIGGSLLLNDTLHECIDVIKSYCEIPVIIFPGSIMQIHSNADAILLLSLISGRNAELLIGQHVVAAPALRESHLEIISTGYILVDASNSTTVSYLSNTIPVPHHKDDIALSTAMAGEMIGMKMIYLDCGSGAERSVSESMAKLVSENVDVPVIVGGGIKSPERAVSLCKAGADMIVVGTAAEEDPSLIISIAHAIHSSITV
ncbi:MAG: geranylgeranylglyceryl/heptaprenylglyceryl phosphate synthase [Chitinophagales bacterium]